MKRTTAVVVLQLASLALATAGLAQTFTVIDSQTAPRGDLTHEIETVVVDGDASQKFRAHRLYRADVAPRGAILLIHGGEASFSFYLEHATGRLSRNVAGFLARNGYDVYGYDPRGSFLTAAQCAAPGSCAFAADWGFGAILEDLEYLKGWVAETHAGEPVIAGLSRGAMVTIAAVNSTPEDYSGAVVWEGMLYSEDPAVLALNAPVCAQLTAALAAGIYADVQTVPVIKAVIELNLLAPDDPSPLFPGLTNREAKFTLLTQPQPSFVPGYTQLAGRVQPPLLYFSKEENIDFSALLLDDVIPMALQQETLCALAGQIDFGAHLGTFDRPVLFIETGKGFGPFMGDQRSLFTAAEISVRRINVYGHADSLSARSAPALVFRSILRWLDRCG